MYKLYPYQEKGVKFLLRSSKRYLGDEMGLGKTVQALTALNQTTHRAKNSLVVCPASLKNHWIREANATEAYPEVVSYNKLALNVELYLKRPLRTIILDEAHYIKNPEAKRTKAVISLCARNPDANVWLLSGTPMPNDPRELYVPLNLLIPETLKHHGLNSYPVWTSKFTKGYHGGNYSRRYYVVTGIKNPKLLTKLLQQTMLRRELSHVEVDLPPLRLDIIGVDAHRGDKKKTTATLDSSIEMKKLLHKGNDYSHAKLRKLIGLHKVKPISDIIGPELQDNPQVKLVLLAHHREVLGWFSYYLGKKHNLKHEVIHGETPLDKRDEVVKNFNKDPDFRVLIGQQQVVGLGLNLQSATEIVLAEPSYSPDDNRQAIKRIHRIGSTKPCRARMFAIIDHSGSLDLKLLEALKRKMIMQKKVYNE